jgi:bifunctional UDP-N-acetylglucosamine pyrophosphorylase / glucosamine-1-phosphate N-acetyltransferase
MDKRASIILAAGKGTRMGSAMPKVLHHVGGVPMIKHVLTSAKAAGIEKNVVVVGHMSDLVQREICNDAICALQPEQKGTGHAVMVTAKYFENPDTTVVVLSGDSPLVRPGTIKKLMDYHEATEADVTVLTAMLDEPFAYGRIIRDEEGHLERIVEEKDATAEEKTIKEINTGTYCFNAGMLFDALKEVDTDNSQGEYYLTDVLEIIREKGGTIRVMSDSDATEVLGVNTLEQLAEVEKIYQARQGAK